MNAYIMHDTTSPAGAGFTGLDNRTLTLRPNTRFETSDGFTASSVFVINADPSSTLAMTGGTIALVNAASANQAIGNFEAGGTTVTAGSDMRVKGSWKVISGTSFAPVMYKVTFTGTDVTIEGNTTWYDFEARTPGATLRFSNYDGSPPATHTIMNNITIAGTPENRITLDRLTDTPGPSSLPPIPTNNFWVIDVSAIGVTYQFDYLNVYHSWALDEINVDPNTVLTGTKAPWWTVHWNREYFWVFSFTEDSDGDGRIDRLRLQGTVANVAGSLSGFKVDVEGYEVSGYEFVPDPLNSPKNAGVYVKVKPKPAGDTGARPVWRLLAPGGVVDDKSGIRLGVPEGFTQKAVDTAAPRVLYSLAHPSKNEVYVQFSEPVNAPSTPVSFGGRPFSGATAVNAGIRLTGANFTPDEVADDTRFDEMTAFNTVYDKTGAYPAAPYPAYVEQPVKPKYPADFDYDSFTEVDIYTQTFPAGIPIGICGSTTGMQFQSSPLPAWASSNGGRRVGDLLLLEQPQAGVPPVSIWPNYALSRSADGEEMITLWDGSKTVLVKTDWTTHSRYADISLFVQNALTPPLNNAPGVLYAFDVPARLRRNENAAGIWLPPISPVAGLSPYFDVARSLVPQTRTPDGSLAPSGAGPFEYAIEMRSLSQKSVFDFIFQAPPAAAPVNPPPLYAVRLDPSASPWWEGAKPFTFIMRDLARQRGAVTILNNVLNPLKGGKTKISYVLTRPGQVTINVFTVDGTLIRTLQRGRMEAGEYFAEWDGKNARGNPVARGMYFVRVVGPDVDEVRKIMLVK